MNILVTGANGQLGHEMRIVAAGSPHRFIFTDIAGDNITQLDITDAEAVERMVNGSAIDVIVNCAAYTNVDAAEDNYDAAERLNADAPAILAHAIKQRGGLLVHISTDYVFGGSAGNTPRTELEPVNPTGVYGITKLHGEEAIAASGCRRVIIRTAWLYSEFGKNFVKTMLHLTSTRPELKVVFDQVGTPTYALDLAGTIMTVIHTISNASNPADYEGIYHYSNEGVCSWYDFTQAIAAIAGTSSDCRIEPCHSNEFPSKVVRPSYSVLDKSKIKSTFNISIPYWVDSLKNCLSNGIQA